MDFCVVMQSSMYRLQRCLQSALKWTECLFTVSPLRLDRGNDEGEVLVVVILPHLVRGRLLSLTGVRRHGEQEAVGNHVTVNHLRLDILDGERLQRRSHKMIENLSADDEGRHVR